MQNFQELTVWRRAHEQVLQIYKLTAEFPQSESFGLVLNLRRCALFVATRIAEGCGKPSDADFLAELKRARATCYELEYLLLVSRDLELIQVPVHDELVSHLIEVRKMVSGFMKRLTPSL